MKTIALNARIFMSIWLLTLLTGGCTTRTTLYKEDCNGEPLELRLITEKTFNNINYSQELRYNGKVVDVIDFIKLHSTAPYDPAVYGNSPWHYIDTTRRFYQPADVDQPLSKIPVMLYVDPAVWSRQDFERVYACLKQHHAAMHQIINTVHEFQAYQFGGIVYGREDAFVQTYAKTKNDHFEVSPDGSIGHTRIDPSGGITGSANGVLNQKIEMPGHRIRIDPAKLSMADVQTYRNTRTNRPLSADFDVRVDTTSPAR